jgi:hypothetical protein
MKQKEFEPTLEQRCMWGRLLFRTRHPDGYICQHNVTDCQFIDLDNSITINYVDRKKVEHFRCNYGKKQNEKQKE